MFTMLKSLAILSAVAAGSFLAQPAKADHVSVSLGIVVPSAPVRVYVTPAPVTTVYSVPSYAYSTTYYAPTYYAPTYVPAPVVVSAPVVYSPPVIVSAPVYCSPSVYCPPPIYVEPILPRSLFLPLPGLRISIGGGGHGHR